MKQPEIIEAVQRMQDYIKANAFNDKFNYDELYVISGYSKRHAERIFKEQIGKTTKEYIRAIKLSKSSDKLLNSNETILDIALNLNYDSHEGYTRAFYKNFKAKPSDYRKGIVPIPLFVEYPASLNYTYLNDKERLNMSKETMLCMTTVVQRPKRKLMFTRSTKAHDYFSFCEEKGCEWEGLLNSLPNKFDTAAILELPKKLVKQGMANIAAGVEIPLDYSGEIPDEYELITLEECDMLYFQTEPFEKEEDFCVAIKAIEKAIEKYDLNSYGYKYDLDLAPKFNFGADTKMGAKQALPIRKS